ncbi:MAG TPA: matrixin family metalloprotease [Bryobacteraceae bacterium]|nr:matrixin family metalloprotease [Bryobacteraceae bacterium]
MRLRGSLAALLLLAPASWGYIRSGLYYGDGSTANIQRTDASAIQFYLNKQIAAGYQSSITGAPVMVISPGSDPSSAVQAAFGTWNAVSTSNIRFLPIAATDKGIDATDKQMTIAFAASADDLSALGYKAGVTNGAVAVTINTAAGFVSGTSPSGDLTDTDIVLNPAISFSTDGSTSVDLQAVMTHELGHALGLNHSGLLGATMFQFTHENERLLSSDELSFATGVYPAKGIASGRIAGKVVAGDGSPVQAGLVTLIDTDAGNAVSALTAPDGTYSAQVPAGSYMIYAEPMTSASVVQPGNLYLPASVAVSSNFQTTVLGGVGSPARISVTGGNTANAPDLTVTGGSSVLAPTFAGIGKAGGSGDVSNVLSATPYVIPSGQSVDFALVGGGIDGTISVAAFGKGVSVHPGSVRVDSGVKFGGSLAGQPLVRFTLDIAPLATSTVASLIITKGSSTLAMSGALVIVPPTPVISSVQDAESVRTTIVPGEWVAIYGSNLASSTKVWGSSDFVNGNVLPKSLGGVMVQFNGTPGAVYVASGGQINVQAPSGLTGSVKVTVSNNGSDSASFTVNAEPVAPSLFVYPAAGKLYPAAVHLNGTIIGDPAALSGTAKAQPGETVIFFVNGLTASASGTILGSVIPYTSPVTVTIGSASTLASFAGQVAAGEFQLNVTIPAGLAPGNYPITVSTQGQTSPSGVTLAVGP